MQSLQLIVKHYQAALIGVVLLFGLHQCRERDRALVERGRLLAVTADYRKQILTLSKRADSLTAAFKVDTVRLVRHLARWDTVKVTDTLTKETIIAVADSTIKACHMSVLTCGRALAAKDSLLARTDSLHTLRLNHARAQLTPERIRWGTLGVLFGVAATLVLVQ